MPKAPRKNISKSLEDIRGSRKRKKGAFYLTAWPLSKDYSNDSIDPKEYFRLARIQNASGKKSKWTNPFRDILKWFRKDRSSFAKTAIILIILISSIYVFNVLDFKDLALGKAPLIYKEFLKAKEALVQLKTEEAENAFATIGQELSIVQEQANDFGFGLIPFLKEIPRALNNFKQINQAGLAIAQNINYLKNKGVSLALNSQGDQIIKTLEELSNQVDGLITFSADIQNQSNKLKGWSSKIAAFADALNQGYLNLNINLHKTKEWLGALLSILKSPQEQHLLVIFQNPSEMRPAGGFIGSFADITLEMGNIKNITIDDIYNADRQMDLKLVPPKQLQSLTKNWGARDANWFFDFPTSARKVIYLMENSNLFKEKSVKFLGLVAINVDVLESLLEITGPIEVPEYQLTLNSQNFLAEVQYEVEAGRDKKPGQNPKKILSVIAPLILEKLTNLDEGKKTLALNLVKNHSQNKDVLFYFKDFTLEDLVTGAGLAGEMFISPPGFNGDYLAVVNANIAAGKTDAFINQKIVLKSEIKNDGSINNNLVIKREHNGQNEKEWWYTTDNKNFIKILIPKNSVLQEISGNYYKSISPLVNYRAAGYEYDTDLQNIENSALIDRWKTEIGQELDKSYFATWFNVEAGAKNSLEIKYTGPRKAIIQNKAAFKFVFDKQSGVNGSLEYSVTAPIGYIFQETGKEIFEYSTPNPKAREIIDLTLIKI